MATTAIPEADPDIDSVAESDEQKPAPRSAVAAALAAEAEAEKAITATKSRAHHSKGSWCGPCLCGTHCRHIPGSPGSRNSPAWSCPCPHCAAGEPCVCGYCTGRISNFGDESIFEPDNDTEPADVDA